MNVSCLRQIVVVADRFARFARFARFGGHAGHEPSVLIGGAPVPSE